MTKAESRNVTVFVTRLSFLSNRVETRRIGNIMKISGKNAGAIVAISRLSE